MVSVNSSATGLIFSPIAGGSQTPWTSNIDAAGYNLDNLVSIVKIGYIQTATIFTGGGKNNVTLTGTYSGSTMTSVTYTVTVTALNSQWVTLGTISGGTVNIGDSVTFVNGATTINSTIEYVSTISGTTKILVASSSPSVTSAYAFTDTTTGATASISAVTVTDEVSWSDGTTTYPNIPLAGTGTVAIPTINGITFTCVSAHGGLTGHTVGNNWTLMVTYASQNVFTGTLSSVGIGDMNSVANGQQFVVNNLGSGLSSWVMKDTLLGNVFSLVETAGPTLTLSTPARMVWTNTVYLAPLSTGYFIQADTSGNLTLAQPLTLGQSMGSINDDGILYAHPNAPNPNQFWSNPNFLFHDDGATGTSFFKMGFGSSSNTWIDVEDDGATATNGKITLGSTSNGGQQIIINDLNSRVKITNIAQYANDATAMAAGLTSGCLYSLTVGGITTLNIIP